MTIKGIVAATAAICILAPDSVSAASISPQDMTYSTLSYLYSTVAAEYNEDHDSQDKKISISVSDKSVIDVLKEIGKKSGLRIYFSTDHEDLKKIISLNVTSVTPIEAAEKATENTNLKVARTADGKGIMVGAGSTVNNRKSIAVTGVIIDSVTGAAIEGATVQLAGIPGTVVVTDRNGTFRIQAPEPGSFNLSVRLLGYISITHPVKITADGVSGISIRLRSAPTSLGEVVTTATGPQRRVEVANDIVKIDPQEIMERAPVRNIADILSAAQVPGLVVQRQSGDAGAPVRFRIRGIGSISQSNDPVIILDGVWIDNGSGSPSRIDAIDPSTIESIEIVRGPSASTLYGQDAANGVIVIRTRRGSQGPTRWSLNLSRDWGHVYGKQSPLYVGIGKGTTTGADMYCPIDAVLRNQCRQDSVMAVNTNHPLIARDGAESINRFAFGVDGGTSSVNYSINLNATDQLGARRPSPVNLIRFRRLGFDTESKFLEPSFIARRGLSTTYSIVPTARTTVTLSLNGATSNLRDNKYRTSFPPILSAGYIDSFSIDTTSIESGETVISPERQKTVTTNILVASNIQHRITESWNASVNVGMERSTQEFRNVVTKSTCTFIAPCKGAPGSVAEGSSNSRTITFRSNLSGALPSLMNGWLELRPAVGMDFRRTDYSSMSMDRSDVPPGTSGTSGGTVFGHSGRTANATAGWYLNTTVGLFNRIYFDAGVRQDVGSAILASRNARYPKIGSSWLVSDESFWRDNLFVQVFRLRAAMGYAAVQPDVADINGRYVTSYSYFEGAYVPSVSINAVGNRGLVPERAMEVEGGFDATLFNDRVDLILTYAHIQNRNTLIQRGTAPSVINSSRKENVARVINNNLEVSANARVIESNDIRLLVNYGLTLSENRVSRIGNRLSPQNISSVGRVEQGYPLGGIWNRMLLGYDDLDENGMISRNEIIVSDSLVFIGWSQPKYRASYGFNVMYKGLMSFDSRLSYQSQYAVDYVNFPKRGLEDQNAPLGEQAIALVSELSGKRSVSDLRWNSASLTFHLPAHIASRFGGRSASVSIQGTNLQLWTNYLGRDPSVNTSLSSEVAVDNGDITPMPRRFVLDFKIGF